MGFLFTAELCNKVLIVKDVCREWMEDGPIIGRVSFVLQVRGRSGKKSGISAACRYLLIPKK